jgi:uncharacterized tellurite resistance protein B-like protein
MRKIAGCTSCVRGKLLLETLRSALDGWTSPGAFFANPVMILYGLARIATVTKNAEAVRDLLRAAGVSDSAPASGQESALRIGYRLAIAMIAADGKINQEEVAAAIDTGKKFFPDFDTDEFIAVASDYSSLPEAADLARALKTVTDAETKDTVFRYLAAIAAADHEMAAEEKKLLRTVAANFGLKAPGPVINATA